MTLPKNVYKALEDIVGARNISDDPALLDSYRYSLAHTAIHLGPYYDTFTPRGAAVYLHKRLICNDLCRWVLLQPALYCPIATIPTPANLVIVPESA